MTHFKMISVVKAIRYFYSLSVAIRVMNSNDVYYILKYQIAIFGIDSKSNDLKTPFMESS